MVSLCVTHGTRLILSSTDSILSSIDSENNNNNLNKQGKSSIDVDFEDDVDVEFGKNILLIVTVGPSTALNHALIA